MSSQLDELVRSGRLAEFNTDLGPRRCPMRRLFMTPTFETWVEELPDEQVISDRLVSPFYEIQAIAASFIAGEKLVNKMTAIDPPTGKGIVRLKTTSFGLLGWADSRQALVLSRGVDIDESHGSDALERLGREAAAERANLGLDWMRGHFSELFRSQN